MKRLLKFAALLIAAGLHAQSVPQVSAGTWKFTAQPASAGNPWTAYLQVQQNGPAVTGTFLTGTGATFPGFTGGVRADGFGSLTITWDATNRDIPGVPQSIPFVGYVSPDGNSMAGTWTLAYPSQVYAWSAVFIPASAPLAPAAPSTPTVAACTASVQSMGPGSLVLTGLVCSVTPATPTGGGLLQFVGDSSLYAIAGAYQP